MSGSVMWKEKVAEIDGHCVVLAALGVFKNYIAIWWNMENTAMEETVLKEIIETCEKIIEGINPEIGKEALKEPKLEPEEGEQDVTMLITEKALWNSPLLQNYIHAQLNDSQLVQSVDIKELAQSIGAKYDVVKSYLDKAYPYRSCFRIADIMDTY